MIDGGWLIPAALDRLQRGLAEIGFGIGDITAVLRTHFHRDHYTLALELRRLTGCPVALGGPERASVDAIMAGERALDQLWALMRRVLPHITPSIRFETAAPHVPLANYLQSLRRVGDRPDARLLPRTAGDAERARSR